MSVDGARDECDVAPILYRDIGVVGVNDASDRVALEHERAPNAERTMFIDLGGG